jgi:DNA-binding NarL/FixJ family response regulator
LTWDLAICKSFNLQSSDFISKREKEIVQQICEGKTNQQIADELFISLQTVKDHTHRIYSKIGINSRMKLVQLVNN